MAAAAEQSSTSRVSKVFAPRRVSLFTSAGMLNFTRTSALELAEYRIRVNAIAPDIVSTESMIRLAPGVVSKEGRAAQARYIPLGRTGNLDDCAGANGRSHSRCGTWTSSGCRKTGRTWTAQTLDKPPVPVSTNYMSCAQR